jgi:hypothetical protein
VIFTLRIRLGNDAVQTPDDVAALLRKTADRLQLGHDLGTDTHTIHDLNGNSVGHYNFLRRTQVDVG